MSEKKIQGEIVYRLGNCYAVEFDLEWNYKATRFDRPRGTKIGPDDGDRRLQLL